jgi:hypothetical protein
VETSQQQRRPNIGQSAKRLRQLGLDFDAIDLADIFWLAQFIELSGAVQLEDVSKPSKEPDAPKTVDITNVSTNEPEVDLYIDDHPSTNQVSTGEAEPEKLKGLPFPVPAAPALRTRLDLARALRPLMRKVPSQNRYELNEDATVTHIAETGMMLPILQSQPERWLDLDFVVEDSKTTIIWKRTIAELQHLMEYQGAFRTVRTWRLAVPNLQTAKPEDVRLFPHWKVVSSDHLSQRPRSPRELLDLGSRRMILFVTDCTSRLWRQGIIHETLWQWAEVQPTSVLQLFPEHLWTRTALSDGYIVRLGATAPGLPSARLDVESLPASDGWDEFDSWNEDVSEASQERSNDQRCLVLPIVSLSPKAMYCWAQVISAVGGVLTPGRFFEMKLCARLRRILCSMM